MYPWMTSVNDHVRCILATNNNSSDSIHLIGHSDTLKAIQFSCNALLGDGGGDGNNRNKNFQITFICRHGIDEDSAGILVFFSLSFLFFLIVKIIRNFIEYR